MARMSTPTARARLTAARPSVQVRTMMGTQAHQPKKEGDISSVFVSLSGADRPPLPDRFRQIKNSLIAGREDRVVASWNRLLDELRRENQIIKSKGSAVIPTVEFKDLESEIERVRPEIKKRGAAVIRGVVPEAEARGYKDEVEEYMKKNPSTRGKSSTPRLASP